MDHDPTHVIRLRGPWEFTLTDGQTGQVNLTTEPAGADGSAADGSTAIAEWRRGFGKPTGLDDDRIFLVIEPSSASATVTLNGVELGRLDADREFACDVTGSLELRNQLVIQPVRHSHQPPFRQVWLGIE